MCAYGINLKYALHWHINIVHSVLCQCHMHRHKCILKPSEDSELMGLKVDIAVYVCMQAYRSVFVCMQGCICVHAGMYLYAHKCVIVCMLLKLTLRQ